MAETLQLSWKSYKQPGRNSRVFFSFSFTPFLFFSFTGRVGWGPQLLWNICQAASCRGRANRWFMATSARCKALVYAFNHTKSRGWIGDWKEMVWWGLMGFYGVRAGIHTDGNSCEHIIWPWDFGSSVFPSWSWLQLVFAPSKWCFCNSIWSKDSHQAWR